LATLAGKPFRFRLRAGSDNGVNSAALLDARNALSQAPEAADFTFLALVLTVSHSTAPGSRRKKVKSGVSPEHVIKIDPSPRHHQENTGIIRREIDHHGLSVVVACRPCIHTKRRTIRTANRTLEKCG
jgi:hypothetical protein